MTILVNLMHTALCRAFLQFQGAPKLSGYSSDQYVEFEIAWQGNDLKGEEIGDIFKAAADVFENSAQIISGKIDTPRQHGHGIIVRVGYPYPFPWYVIGRKPNGAFARQLAICDIARCLDLNNSTSQTQRLLHKTADPSTIPYRFWRSYVLTAEKKRLEKARSKAARLREKRKSDFV